MGLSTGLFTYAILVVLLFADMLLLHLESNLCHFLLAAGTYMLELKLAISRVAKSLFSHSSVDAVHIAYMYSIRTEESLTQAFVQARSQHGLIMLNSS